MGDQQRRHLLGVEDLGHGVQQPQPGFQIEAGEGLVEQQHPRTRRQRPRQRDPLLLSSGEGLGQGIAQRTQAGQLQQFVDAPCGFSRRQTPQAIANVALHGHVREQGEVLEHQPDPTAFRVEGQAWLADQAITDADLPSRNIHEPGQRPEQGGLAAAARADQRQPPAILNGQ